jgi:diguanylate cyclase (GGDEF)-like protein
MPVEGPRLRLLLVEDSPADARLIREAFKDAGVAGQLELCVVHNLGDAEAAVRSGSYDCVLLDLGLPDVSGVGNVQRIRAVNRSQAIVVTTGLDSEEAALRSLQGGAQDYVVKGRYTGDGLLRTVRRAIERNRVLAEMERSREEQYRLATRDTLTGLPNRLLFEETARRALVMAEREHSRLAIGFLDLNGFKRVNDTHGHTAGDALLQHVGQILVKAIRNSDAVARVGGDEFVLLLAPIHDDMTVAAIGERLREQIEAIREIDGRAISISASIGFAFYPEHARTLEMLMMFSDKAMFESKRIAQQRAGKLAAGV